MHAIKMNLWVAILVTVFIANANAQDGGNPKLESAKIGLITNRLNLSAEQAAQFWPVYNDFDAKKKDIRKSLRKLVIETNTLTTSDDKILANLREGLNLQQKEVDLEREYMAKFLKVINVRQLAELYKAEQLFTSMLLKKLNQNRLNAKE